MVYPVDRWNECEGGELSVAPLLIRLDNGWIFHNLLVIIDLLRSALSVVPLSIVSGGCDFPLATPLTEGARRTADLYIIPFEHSAPGDGQ